MNSLAKYIVFSFSLAMGIQALASSLVLTATSSFAEAQRTWQSSEDISTPEINGNWKRVAVYEHVDCENVMHGNAFDSTGIKNSDGSSFTLSFEGHQVRFLNVGKFGGGQGPYEVTSEKAEFSSWAYDENTSDKAMTDQAYGEYSCRQLEASREKMICSVGSRLKVGAVSDPTFKACSQHKAGLILLFTKMN